MTRFYFFVLNVIIYYLECLQASTEPLNKDMNDSVDSLEEKNPDIIPQNNADDEYQDEERAFERLNNAPSVRVYSRLQSPNNQTKNGGGGYASKTMVILITHYQKMNDVY